MTTPKTCVVRVLDSSWDEFPDLLSAFHFAEKTVNSCFAAPTTFADVHDRHGFVARIQSDSHKQRVVPQPHG